MIKRGVPRREFAAILISEMIFFIEIALSISMKEIRIELNLQKMFR